MKKTHKVSKEVKDQILGRIKNDGVTVANAAREHGISEATIYNWLAKGVRGQPTVLEMAKLKKKNKELLELVGKLTVDLSNTQKNR
jgi:transposase-like protein